MIKKTIKFPNWDGEIVEETFHFNLTKAELAEMELEKKGGLYNYLQTIIESEDNGEILKMFKRIIVASIGKRSEDGKRFIKNDEIRSEFLDTQAYSTMLFDIMSNPDEASSFIRGIIPADLEEPKDQDKPDPRDLELARLRAQLLENKD